MLRNVIVAGTFDTLHRGHEKLFGKALSSGKSLSVGITSDRFAGEKKPKPRNPFQKRLERVKRFLGKDSARATFFKLEDPFGPSIHSSAFDGIVVSPETEGTAQEINWLREKEGLNPLKVLRIETEYAQDFKKISSSRINARDITREGKRLKNVRISFGTKNPDKLEGAQKALQKAFRRITVKAFEVKSRVSPQPFGEETLEGAIGRAQTAYLRTDCDFGIGLESGIFRFGESDFVFLWCAIFDGQESFLGCSMGFALPEGLAERAERGTLKKAFSRKHGSADGGVIRTLSNGLLTRGQMARQACSCALVGLLSRGKKHL